MIRTSAIVTTVIIGIICLVACGQPVSGPIDAVKNYTLAAQRKDVATMKSLLSKGTLEMFGTIASATGESIDDLLMKEATSAPSKIDVREIEVKDESAIVAIFNESTGEYDLRLPLVKEGGSWKLARDVYTLQNLK